MPTILQAVESALDQLNNAKRDFDDERGRVQKDLQDISLDIKKLRDEVDAKDDAQTKALLEAVQKLRGAVDAKDDAQTKALLEAIQTLRNELAQAQAALVQAIKAAESAAAAAQKTANVGVSLARPLAESEALQQFVAQVNYSQKPFGKYFEFPNLLAWDVRANGQFYSGHSFISNSPT